MRAELRDRGPSRPAEIRGDAPGGRGGWWEWDEVKHALEYLWRIGDVAIAGRDGFERRYALAEDVVPVDLLGRDLDRVTAVGVDASYVLAPNVPAASPTIVPVVCVPWPEV